VLQYKDNAVKRGREMLQMPPVKKAWDVGEAAKSNVLCTDDISMWEDSGSRYVFTDITYGLPHRVSYFLTDSTPSRIWYRNLMPEIGVSLLPFCALPDRSQAALPAVRCITIYYKDVKRLSINR